MLFRGNLVLEYLVNKKKWPGLFTTLGRAYKRSKKRRDFKSGFEMDG